MDYKLISADSHVNEPLSMWQERMPAEFRHKAPHRKVVDGKLLEIRDGMRPRRVELGTEEMDKDDLLRENAVEDGWDVKVRGSRPRTPMALPARLSTPTTAWS